jgi:hypothetical protein
MVYLEFLCVISDCRGADNVYDKSYFGSGMWNFTDILMDEVSCTGQETELLSCPYTIDHDCSVNELVSVACKKNMGKILWNH